MENDRFEDEIKNKLDNHLEQYDSSSWDRLSHSLDQADLSDDFLEDEQHFPGLKEKLTSHKERVRDEHWQKMKQELDAIDERRETLWTIKLIEFSIFLLLLLTYWNISGHRYFPKNENHFLQADLTEFATSTDDNIRYENETPLTKTISSPLKRALERNSRESVTTEVQSEIGTAFTASIVPLTITVNQPALATLGNQALSELNSVHIDVSSLPVLEISPLQVKTSEHIENRDMAFQEFVAITRDDKLSNGFWMSISFSRDVNLINSSLDLLAIRSHFLSGDHGASAGVQVSYQFKNLELETGLRYSEKAFNPGLIRAFSKASYDTYLETQLEQIQFKQLQIPLLAKIHAYNDSRSNLYLHGGISFNAIMDYQYTTLKTVQPSARVTALDDYNTLNLNNLATGISEGGNIKDNVYLSAIVGVGFQTLLKNHTAIFFQPQYEFNISRGANEYIRRVHTFSLQGGLRFKF